MAQFATVAAIKGNGTVFAVNEQGVSRALKAGDTLHKIALQHGATKNKLVEMNGLKSADHIVPGQKLKVPKAN